MDGNQTGDTDFKKKSSRKVQQLSFPASDIHKKLKKFTKNQLRIKAEAAVYLEAVIAYSITEMFHISGRIANGRRKKRITPRDIMLAARMDSDFSQLLQGVEFRSSGNYTSSTESKNKSSENKSSNDKIVKRDLSDDYDDEKDLDELEDSDDLED
uniref:Histone H2A n=1 Tax=Parastrongyloides trichosuri TaxID=131310 RepID=A0A0N5A0G6_PARTI